MWLLKQLQGQHRGRLPTPTWGAAYRRHPPRPPGLFRTRAVARTMAVFCGSRVWRKTLPLRSAGFFDRAISPFFKKQKRIWFFEMIRVGEVVT